MSHIEELIAEHCPDGVAFVTLAELLNYQQPSKFLVKSVAYDDSFTTPVLTAGQTFILGHTDEVEGVYPASIDSPVIIFDDFTTAFKWVDFPFKAKSSAMKMLTPKSGTDLRFVWLAMQTIPYVPQDHARQWIGTYSQFRIPVPPLEIQREIVRILDTFSKMEVELEVELEARKQQYEHYRNKFFQSRDGVLNFSLSSHCDFRRGTAITKKKAIPGPVPVVANGPVPSYTHNQRNRDANTIVVARSGAYAGLVSYWEEPIFLTDAFSVHPDEKRLSSRYVFHALQAVQSQLHGMKKGAGVPHVRVKEIQEFSIPVPSKSEQERVSDLLDKFDTLVNDLSIGLPAELAARRQQYEYYRDKLLTFKELEPAS